MFKLKKIGRLTLSILLAASMSGCSTIEKQVKPDAAQHQKQFDEFIDQEFLDTMNDDYFSVHTFLEHPENYGIDVSKLEVTIGEPDSDESYEEAKEETAKAEKKFKEFDRSLLTQEQQETYDIYNYMLETALQSGNDKFRYIGNPFSSVRGIQANLPTLFADHQLRNEQDVKDLVTLLESVKPYIDSLLTYVKKQEEQNTLMIDIDAVVEYCQNIIDTGLKNSTLTSMKEHIKELNLGKQKTEQYQQAVQKAYQDFYLSSYEAIIQTMRTLDPSKNNTEGLAKLKDGKAYYSILFRNAIGSSKSIKQMETTLRNLANECLSDMQAIVKKNPKLASSYTNIKTTYKDFESMLKDLDEDIKNDFPKIKELDYEIKPLDADISNSSIAAYFNIPAIDGTTPKQMRVNTSGANFDIQSLDTFTTVAHEGIPGHMYQNAYENEHMPNPWRKLIPSFLGYTEGYANYVENYVSKYLDIDQDLVKLSQSQSILSNCVVSLIDIYIHYEGYTKKDVEKFVTQLGLGYDIDALYQQIQDNPTAFLSYYAGYAEINELKEKAQKELGDHYQDLGFHEALLKSGAAPFAVVAENVDAYIESAK